MQVRVTPELARKLSDVSPQVPVARPDELVAAALTGYVEKLVALRETLDPRYDELKSGRVAPIDGEEAARRLRDRSERRRAGG